MAEKVRNLIETNKIVRRLIALVLSFCLLLAIVVVYLRNSLGWFAGNIDANGRGMSVIPESTVFPAIHAWRFDIDGGELTDSFLKNGNWVEGMDTLTTNDENDLKSVLPKDTTNDEKYQFISLHLGSVDNLLTLSEDNCFYIRLDVTSETIASFGKSVRAGYTVSDLHFYDSNGVDQTETISQNYMNTYSALLNLVDIDCAVSLNERNMTGTNSSTDIPIIEGFFKNKVDVTVNADSNQYVQLNHSGTAVDVYTTTEGENGPSPYYLYIRLRPDLDKCFSATYDIARYMPCQLVFDITLEFEFY